jgi:DNA-binding transcriptional ArsR family regulator
MDARIKAKYEARARIIKALAHPARLLIVDELGRRGEQCVCKLTDLIGTDISTVSRHLAVLKHAGIIEDEKRGVQVYYKLRVRCVLDFVQCVESVMQSNTSQQNKVLRLCRK